MVDMEDNLRRLKALQKECVQRTAFLDQYDALRRDLGIDKDILRKLTREEKRQLQEMVDKL